MKTEVKSVVTKWRNPAAMTRIPTSAIRSTSAMRLPEMKDKMEQTELEEVLKVEKRCAGVQCEEILADGPQICFSDRVDVDYDQWGKLFLSLKFIEDLEVVEEQDEESDDEPMSSESPDLGDSDDEEDMLDVEDCRLSAKQGERRRLRKEREGFRLLGLSTESDVSDLMRSNGNCLPLLTMPGPEETINSEHASKQSPKAKPQSAIGRRARWRHIKELAKLNLATGEVERAKGQKLEDGGPVSEDVSDELECVVEEFRLEKNSWMYGKYEPNQEDVQRLMMWEEENSNYLLGFNWRSEPEMWQEKKWVKVASVMDSGAAAPVAPPSMLLNVKIEPSPGRIRGQTYTSASKHRLNNLGQQKIHAFTEEGDETSVLFQIADVSKPLVSVASICERCNRVICGKAGGVVQSLSTGKEIPFHRRNGIYVLSFWLDDSNDQRFTRP